MLELLPTEASETDLLEVTAAVARVLLQLLRVALELPVPRHRTRQFCEHVVGARHVVRTVLGAWNPRTRKSAQCKPLSLQELCLHRRVVARRCRILQQGRDQGLALAPPCARTAYFALWLHSGLSTDFSPILHVAHDPAFVRMGLSGAAPVEVA